ncbi:small nuclear RNA activating complex, polypeptide 3 [Linnemannia exigua]|uniref:Small nuclear RNA activating complex, polypeptide 3 n=1 Tax=Linnemannia exigua TaxID=604196 RepID=A0AAD4DAN9_9FUNG|nr:small nuclear RNA activating complex, polypeptide 3 [Linnemannia exigua]
MESEEASVHSGRPRDRRPPPGGWALDAPRIIHSIVNVMPQGNLFHLQSFSDEYHQLVQASKDTDPYDAYFGTGEDREEVERQMAAKFDTWDDTELVNDMFGDPTVLGLLQEWHEERLGGDTRAAGTAASRNLRPTWSSIFGKVDGMTELGDQSNLHLKGRFTPHAGRPVTMGDDNVRRLLSSAERGRKRVPFVSRRGSGKPRALLKSTRTPRVPNKANEASTEAAAGSQTQDNGEGSSSAPNPTATMTLADINPSINPTNTDETGTETSPAPSIPDGMSPEEHAQLQKDARLIEQLAEQRAQQEIENQIAKTSLESKFQKCSLMVEDSTLASLSPRSQVLLPTHQRPPLNFAPAQPPRFSRPFHPIMDNELIISAAIYNARRPDQRMQEFLFLGSQRLSALRDAFECASDVEARDWEEYPEVSNLQNTAERKTSNSFFFIEGVFYSDTPLLRARLEKRDELREEASARREELEKQRQERYQEAVRLRNIRRRELREDTTLGSTDCGDENIEDDDDLDLEFDDSDLLAQMEETAYLERPIEHIAVQHQDVLEKISEDYSQVILDWVAESPGRRRQQGFSNLEKKYMHDTKIQDLAIRLNQPYLFVHQGDCEHILMFRDLRLFSQRHDDLNRLSYPLQIFKGKSTSHMCRMCKINKAFYVTVDDRLAGETPCYFCEQCYDRFHYDLDGNILYDDFRSLCTGTLWAGHNMCDIVKTHLLTRTRPLYLQPVDDEGHYPWMEGGESSRIDPGTRAAYPPRAQGQGREGGKGSQAHNWSSQKSEQAQVNQ